MEYHELLKYVREGNEDGEEYVLEWIAEMSTDGAAKNLVNAVFDARDSEDDSHEQV